MHKDELQNNKLRHFTMEGISLGKSLDTSLLKLEGTSDGASLLKLEGTSDEASLLKLEGTSEERIDGVDDSGTLSIVVVGMSIATGAAVGPCCDSTIWLNIVTREIMINGIERMMPILYGGRKKL